MGYTLSIIAIKGEHIAKAGQIFEAFAYEDKGNDKSFEDYDAAIDYLFQDYHDLTHKNIALRGFWQGSGWTLIFDPEMVDNLEEEAIAQISTALNTTVLSFLIQSTSNSFAFAKYEGTRQRNFFAVEGEVFENEGEPLPEEVGLNISEEVFIDDILQLAQKFGVDLEGKSVSPPFTVKELASDDTEGEEPSELPLTPEAPAQNEPKPAKKKRWWQRR